MSQFKKKSKLFDDSDEEAADTYKPYEPNDGGKEAEVV